MIDCLKTALLQILGISVAVFAIALIWTIYYLDWRICAVVVLFLAILGATALKWHLRSQHAASTEKNPVELLATKMD